MSVRDYPFSVIRPGDIARPYLPIIIINPDTEKQINVYALIDTGADECAFPGSFNQKFTLNPNSAIKN